MDNIESTDERLRELALFAGAGGGILGGHLLGWRTICAVEWDAYARDVLVARQNDGCLEAFSVWDDVQTFDGRPWRGRVDVVSGGFPCQDISCAGKGAGIEGERSSMWKHMARIIGEVLPQFVFVENSPMLVGRGLAVVIADLAKMGYDAKWGVVGAHHAGAPHKRDRIWIVADSMCSRQQGSEWEREASEARQSTGHALQCCGGADVADTNGIRGDKNSSHSELRAERSKQSSCNQRQSDKGKDAERSERDGWWSKDPADGGTGSTEPDVGRVAHGVVCRVDRLRCIGNGQVPAVAKLAWEVLSK
jgi:DNA (cytosine-5)-methyltransferase 1